MADFRLSVGPQPAGPGSSIAAQFAYQLPVASSLAAKGAFSHAVRIDERRNLVQDWVLFHEEQLLRVITRMSTPCEWNYTILRGIARAPIHRHMSDSASINMEKLKADMAAAVAGSSARAFSLKVTGGRNADFYRNFIGGQDKRMSADIFVGIVAALGRNPAEYTTGLSSYPPLPNATVLTSAFAMLLDSLGVDPFQDERAQKLARQFPNVLRRFSNLHEAVSEGEDATLPEYDPSHGADRPSA